MKERQMPRYQCHKKVHALKINSIRPNRTADNGSVLCDVEDWPTLCLSAEFVAKHNPQAGGYYVIYEDGYASFSPAEAFENGYTRLS